MLMRHPSGQTVEWPSEPDVVAAVQRLGRRGTLTLARTPDLTLELSAGPRKGIVVSYRDGLTCKYSKRPIALEKAERIAVGFLKDQRRWRYSVRWRNDGLAWAQILDSVEEDPPPEQQPSRLRRSTHVLSCLLIVFGLFFVAGFARRGGRTIGEMLFLNDPTLRELIVYNIGQAAVLTIVGTLFLLYYDSINK